MKNQPRPLPSPAALHPCPSTPARSGPAQMPSSVPATPCWADPPSSLWLPTRPWLPTVAPGPPPHSPGLPLLFTALSAPLYFFQRKCHLGVDGTQNRLCSSSPGVFPPPRKSPENKAALKAGLVPALRALASAPFDANSAGLVKSSAPSRPRAPLRCCLATREALSQHLQSIFGESQLLLEPRSPFARPGCCPSVSQAGLAWPAR